MTDVKFV